MKSSNCKSPLTFLLDSPHQPDGSTHSLVRNRKFLHPLVLSKNERQQRSSFVFKLHLIEVGWGTLRLHCRMSRVGCSTAPTFRAATWGENILNPRARSSCSTQKMTWYLKPPSAKPSTPMWGRGKFIPQKERTLPHTDRFMRKFRTRS